MKINIHHLNRDRVKIGIKELDLTKYVKFGSTGSGIYFQPKKGRGFAVSGEREFNIYEDLQRQNDEAAGRHFAYAKIDENLPGGAKNRKRDSKGKPIRVYEVAKDIYEESGMAKWWFIDDDNWNKLLEYVKLSGTPHLYYDLVGEKWEEE